MTTGSTGRVRRWARPTRPLFTIAMRTVTPIFGGGTQARQVDRITPIRGPSIRGQLRFWWRALFAHRHDDPCLAEREAELWGGMRGDAPRRSRVDVVVWVDETAGGGVIKSSDPAAYALWPAREEPASSKPAAEGWRPGVLFRLRILGSEDDRNELEQTVRAWLLFGGIGGRTRRGCGSLTVTGEDADTWLPADVSAGELRKLVGEHISLHGPDIGREPDQTPSLDGATLYYDSRTQQDAEKAWHIAIEWLQEFRQGAAKKQSFDHPLYAREPWAPAQKGRRAGRSRWPEADHVRLIEQGHGRYAHAPRYRAASPVWPRASFGLPIIGRFQQKDRDGKYYRPAEPEGFTLTWRASETAEHHDRLASPLIVKAIPLRGGKFAPIALWLFRAYPDGNVVLDRGRNGSVPGSAAPFDKLLGDGDTAHFPPLQRPTNDDNAAHQTPLEAWTMREAFFTWLEKEYEQSVRSLER